MVRKFISIGLFISCFCFSVYSQTPSNILFDLHMGKVVYRGYIYGEAGMFRIDYNQDHPFEITDENGMVHGLFMSKIDTIEVELSKDGKANITVTSVGKTSTGKFEGASLFLVTDTEEIDILKIKKGKAILIRAKN